MAWFIGILTAFLILDCLLLGLLVLIQLPKKEAGMGTAFGGGATDALFGAGTGNALTKMTKYATVVFFVLTMSLSMLRAHNVKAKRESFGKAVSEAKAPEMPPVPGTTNEATEVEGATNAAPANTNAPEPSPAAPATTTPPPVPADPPAATPTPPEN